MKVLYSGEKEEVGKEGKKERKKEKKAFHPLKESKRK